MENERKYFIRQVVLVASTALKVVGDASHLGFAAILLPALRKPDSGFQTNKHIDAWIASVQAFGMLLSLFFVPPTIDRFGRKACHIASALPMALGWTIIVFATKPSHIIVARLIQGISVGYRTPVSTMVIAESTDPRYRGSFLGTISLSLAVGILVSHFTGTFLDWRLTAVVCLVLGIVSTIMLFFFPDTPTWLAKVGRFDDAKRAFIYYRGFSEESKNEFEQMLQQQREMLGQKSKESQIKRNKVREVCKIFKKSEFHKPILIMFVMFVVYTFAGTYVMSSYTVDIIMKVTGSNLGPYFIMNSIDVFRIIVSIFTCMFIKRFRRRIVYFTSLAITFASLILLSFYIYFSNLYSFKLDYILLGALMAYIVGIGTGIQSLPYVIMGEIFSVQYKGFASSITLIYMSVLYFMSIASGPYMFADLGEAGTFLVYAGVTLACWVIMFFILPETKDKTLQEIQEGFQKKKRKNMGKEYELQNIVSEKN